MTWTTVSSPLFTRSVVLDFLGSLGNFGRGDQETFQFLGEFLGCHDDPPGGAYRAAARIGKLRRCSSGKSLKDVCDKGQEPER